MLTKEEGAPYQESPDYQAALKHARDFKPQDGTDYGWVCKHARTEYQRFADAADALDDKAGTIINYLGAFSGITAITFAYQAVSTHWLLGLSILPVLGLAVWGICISAMARRPMGQPFPPGFEKAVEYAEVYGTRAEARFAAQFGTAAAGMKFVVLKKAALIQKATAKFIWAVVLLILPVLCGVGLALFDC